MKAVLFDLGGVVLRINPGAVFEHWARAAGTTIDDISQQWGLDRAYEEHEVGAIDFAEYAARLGERLGITLPQAQWQTGWNALFEGVFEEVVDLLPQAAQTLPLYCYTNTNRTHQLEWQRLFGAALAPFQKVYVSSEIGRRKPDVESYRWVADDMGFDPADIVFLDDNAENIAGADRAGLTTVHVTGQHVTTEFLRGLLQQPD